MTRHARTPACRRSRPGRPGAVVPRGRHRLRPPAVRDPSGFTTTVNKTVSPAGDTSIVATYRTITGRNRLVAARPPGLVAQFAISRDYDRSRGASRATAKSFWRRAANDPLMYCYDCMTQRTLMRPRAWKDSR